STTHGHGSGQCSGGNRPQISTNRKARIVRPYVQGSSYFHQIGSSVSQSFAAVIRISGDAAAARSWAGDESANCPLRTASLSVACVPIRSVRPTSGPPLPRAGRGYNLPALLSRSKVLQHPQAIEHPEARSEEHT